MNLTIIGFGSFGQAIANIVKTNTEIKLKAWDVVDTGDSRQVMDIIEAVREADVIFFAVPSAFFADCLKEITDIPEHTILVSGTKGIDGKTGKFPYELLQEAFPKNDVAVLSGPMLADELTKGIDSCATVASTNRKAYEQILSVFTGTTLKLCFCKDVLGVSLAGILKNVYTLIFGLSDGLEMGANFKSCLVLQAVKEMQAIIQVLGGEASTMMTHAGLGDLLATGYSTSSRNYSYGFAVGQKEDVDKGTVEGIDNIATVLTKLPDKNSFPLIGAVEDIFLKDIEDKKERLLQALRSC